MAGTGSTSHHSSLKLQTSGSTLWTILCVCTLLGAAVEGIVNLHEGVVSSTNDDGMIGYGKPFITAENSQFGATIEGTSVDSFGRVYAVDFQDQKSQLGQLSDALGGEDQRLFFKWDDENSQFNDIRFFPIPPDNSELNSAGLVADKKGQVLQILQNKAGVVRARVSCKTETAIEPNDLAIAYKSGRLYFTGLSYAPTMTHGEGGLWLCKTHRNVAKFSSNASESVVEAVRLSVRGRTNGIEVSWDEEHLYASETSAKDMKNYSNVVWRYDIDAKTGNLSNKKLFFDMKEIDDELQGEDGGDVAGVRTDMAGNLYIVRNGKVGEVVKISAEGKIAKRIKPEAVTEPTSIELAGWHGTVLFIVGKCKANLTKGCVDVWENDDAPGRAFFNLWRPVPKPFALVSQQNHHSAPILQHNQSSTDNTKGVRPIPRHPPPISQQILSSTDNTKEVRPIPRHSAPISQQNQPSTYNTKEVRPIPQHSAPISQQILSSTDNTKEARPIPRHSAPISQQNQPSTYNTKEVRPIPQHSAPISQQNQSSTDSTNENRPIPQHSAPISHYNQSIPNYTNESRPILQHSAPISQYNQSSTNDPNEVPPSLQSSTNNTDEGRSDWKAAAPVSHYDNRSSTNNKHRFPPGLKFQTEIVLPYN